MSVYVKRTSTAADKIVPNLTFQGYKSLAINSGDFKSSGDTFFVYYHVGPICIVSFYLTAAKAFGTWYDAIVNGSSTIPSPAMAVPGSSSMDSIYMGGCWAQNNYQAQPLIQVTNMGLFKLRTMNASFSSGESFRGTFAYITDDTIL